VTPNQTTVEHYMEAFRRTDHAAVLACLTDDVEWLIPGALHVKGRAAFDGQIESDAFIGHPEITVTRVVEENDVVVTEGRVRSTRADGSTMHMVFCDVFLMRDAKIRHLTSYLMEVPSFP
jgi:ketosteroid isomerase-like protein